MAAKVVDVALGCNHTVALDSAGRVWTWGSSNRHLQLGRPLESWLQPLPIALPDDVIWQRVLNLIDTLFMKSESDS
jgi:alpha-tubulin suppressor-like RCC1 family protein